jgi:hypothetical protein
LAKFWFFGGKNMLSRIFHRDNVCKIPGGDGYFCVSYDTYGELAEMIDSLRNFIGKLLPEIYSIGIGEYDHYVSFYVYKDVGVSIDNVMDKIEFFLSRIGESLELSTKSD